MDDAVDARFVARSDPRLAERIGSLARQRMVLFAGLPGTGKSLLVHQLTHLARASGRTVHLLQWDLARPVFEASAAGQRYPLADGVTHPVIRKAAGRWVRQALAEWSESHPASEHLLVGETPFVGHRFIELAHRLDDRAEPLLTDRSCRFVIAVPSAEVRHFLEAERERRAADPLHPREREDAPPSVLRDLWRDLTRVARQMGISVPVAAGRDDTVPYAPDVYQKVYERILRHRNVEIVNLDVILPTRQLSVYDFDDPPTPLIPSEAQIDECIEAVERDKADAATLEREIACWWQV
jgi:hypothetical protein